VTLANFIEHCLAKKGVEETNPFGPNVLVYKVGGKIFALTSPDDFPPRVNLKCDPDRALQLRDEYESVIPDYQMNNTS
jgi:predicted DNA-binding protein (MmcQ/YjbR family)